MSSTTRTAENESGLLTPAMFSWTFPGAPIRINLPMPLVSRLQAEIDRLESSESRNTAVEAGGILVGHQKTPVVLEIDDCIWVPSGQRPGSPFKLDAATLERLRTEHGAQEEKSGARRTIVGFFRTQAKETLRLRDDEITFVQEQFRSPTDVVLLIQTASRPRTAGFFFWMDSTSFAPFSFLDFPLDAKRLEAQSKPALTAAPVAPPEEIESPEIDIDTTVPEPAFEEEIQPQPIPVPAAERAFPEARYSPELRGADKPYSDSSVAGRRIVAAVIVALLAIGGLAAYKWRRNLFPAGGVAPVPVAVAVPPAFPLQLEVEAQGAGLNVRWNPQSTAVIQGREGRLTILEAGKDPQIIPLDGAQLAIGHVYYRSAAERLQFQLEIVDNTGKTSRESVMALSSPAPAVPPVQANRFPGGTTYTPVIQQPPTRTVISVPIADPGPESAALASAAEAKPAPRRFTPPPSSRTNSQTPAIAFDQAPTLPSDNLPTTPNLGAAIARIPAPAPAQPAPAVPPQAAPVQTGSPKPVRIGGNVQAANLIKRVSPVYPPAAAMARIEGTVRFTALIGKDGSVRNLRAIGGNVVLAEAAAEAVRQWVYKPTLLNGEPVEVITQIDVSFNINH